MKRLIVLLIALALVAGCGYNPDDPVYDTKANPHEFPAPALALLDSIEANPTYPADSISLGLAELYTYNPDMLENDPWRDVINRLGLKLRYRAEQLTDSGLSEYPEVMGLYALASAMRPEDELMKSLSRQFFCFDSSALMFAGSSADSLQLADRLNYLRQRLFTDTACHAFTRNYLAEPILDPFLSVRTTASQIVRALPDRQVALIDYLGYDAAEPDTTLIQFDEPRVRLVAHDKMLQPNSGMMRIELFFMPKQTIDSGWQFWLVSDEVAAGVDVDSGLGFAAAVPMIAWEPIESWRPGHTMAVTGEVPSTTANHDWQLALVAPGEVEYTFAREAQTGKMFVPVDLIVRKSSD